MVTGIPHATDTEDCSEREVVLCTRSDVTLIEELPFSKPLYPRLTAQLASSQAYHASGDVRLKKDKTPVPSHSNHYVTM